MAAAQAHLDALVDALKKQYPADYPAQEAWTVRLVPLSESVVGSVRQSLILLFGAVRIRSADQLRQRRQPAARPSQRARP
jgi:hypothetical protein